MKWVKRHIVILVLIFSTAGCFSYIQADAATTGASGNRFAILPFYNLSGSSGAPSKVMEMILKHFDSRQLSYVSHDELRSILRHYRIRLLGSINGTEISQITQEAHVDYFLLGTVNFYEDRDNPEISISVRIINARTKKVIAAATRSATGKDYEKLFGTGIIGSIDVLLDKVVDELFDDLFTDQNEIKTHAQNDVTVVIIPFDNLSEKKNAGLIVSSILLSDLVNKGYEVIEPGIVQEVMMKHRRILRGEIDFSTLDTLKSLHDFDVIVTGSVDLFEPSRGSTQPRLELGMRMLDASNGKIICMYNDARRGNDSESFFGFGKILSMGKLISKSNDKFINEMEKKREKYVRFLNQ